MPDEEHISLAVLNERLKNMQALFEDLKRQCNRIETEIKHYQYVTRAEFEDFRKRVVYSDGRYWLVERIAFSIAGLSGLAVLASILWNIGLRAP